MTWGSSDDAVTTVSSTGSATGVTLGSATITGTSEGQTGSASIAVVTNVAAVPVTPNPAEV